ncbi:GNAT family N-acetyltransferase [Nocardioides speluncae]|uniref:GNAT family N-acetyltransferase n=1 Tax=Nocardioides speluncae TaxID=2670337 RepID=UPI000D68CB4A|nr:GNAT family N-acetyltransferase [Nocardioides speluncae]
MSATLRPIRPADHPFVLDLNARNVDLLSPLDDARLTALIDWADRADLVLDDGEPAGFVVMMAPGTTYDSVCYGWWSDRCGDQFYYLDRVVLDDRFRRRGLGGFVYDEMERAAAPYGRLALEVNCEPPNEASLAFHRRRGFVEEAELAVGDKKVVMMSLKAGGAGR